MGYSQTQGGHVVLPAGELEDELIGLEPLGEDDEVDLSVGVHSLLLQLLLDVLHLELALVELEPIVELILGW